MLSRRRSSEQIAASQHHQDIHQLSSPTLRRLTASIRHVTLLFAVIAHPDTAAPSSSTTAYETSNITSNTTGATSTTNTNAHTQPLTNSISITDSNTRANNHNHKTSSTLGLRRRLFLQRSNHHHHQDHLYPAATSSSTATTAQPIQRLVVGLSRKNSSLIKLYQILDYYPNVAKVSVVKSWHLSQLRRIDGLGLPINQSLKFGLFLNSNNSMLVWRCRNPSERAHFLWTLLQTCAQKYNRAPPVTGLKLLDLEKFNDNPQQLMKQQQNNDSTEEDVQNKIDVTKMKKTYSNINADDDDDDDDDDEDDEDDDDSTSDSYSPSIHRNLQNRSLILGDKNLREITDPLAYVSSPTPSMSPTSPQPSPSYPNNNPSASSSAMNHDQQQYQNRSMKAKQSKNISKRSRPTNGPTTTSSLTSSLTASSHQPQNNFKSSTNNISNNVNQQYQQQRVTRPPTGAVRKSANVQRVTRTLSEPKVSSAIQKRPGFTDEDDEDEEERQPETIMVPSRMIKREKMKASRRRRRKQKEAEGRDIIRIGGEEERYGGESDEFNKKENDEKELNIDERAFLAAAKRMGAKEQSPMCKEEVIEQFANVGRDPKEHVDIELFQNYDHANFDYNRNSIDNSHERRKRINIGMDNGMLDDTGIGDMGIVLKQKKKKGIGLLMSERKIQQEIKSMKLGNDEIDDVSYALDLFEKNFPSSNCDIPLNDFATWAESQIQELEVENISDIVTAEKQQQQKYTTNSSDHVKNKTRQVIRDEYDPYDVLVESLREISPWLEKNETLLKPYANLANDVNEDVKLLEQQMKNVNDLKYQLNNLMKSITISNENEYEIIEDLENNILNEILVACNEHPNEINYSHVYQATDIITKQLELIENNLSSKLHSMNVVKNMKSDLVNHKLNIAKVVLPCLCKFLDVQYRQDKVYTTKKQKLMPEDIRLNISPQFSNVIFKEFTKGVTCLYMCGKGAFLELLDHYISSASTWICHVTTFIMEFSPSKIYNGESVTKKSDPNNEQQDGSVKEGETDGDYINRLMDSIFYSCLAEGFRAFRLFSPILHEISSHLDDDEGKMNEDNENELTTENINLGNIIRRLVPSVSFIDEVIRKRSTGEEQNGKDDSNQEANHACLMLYMSSMVDTLAITLQNAVSNGTDTGKTPKKDKNDKLIEDVVCRVESSLGLDPFLIPSSSIMPLSYRRTQFDSSISQAATSTNAVLEGYKMRVGTASATAFQRSKSLDVENEIIGKQIIPYFTDGCINLSSECYDLVDHHIRHIISMMSSPRDISDHIGRATFFSRVKQSVNLCGNLASVWSISKNTKNQNMFAQNGYHQNKKDMMTKTLCDKLIAGAMRNIEVISSTCPNPSSGELVKLQCYGFIAARLSSSSPILSQLAHLSTRVHRHVMSKWIEENVMILLPNGSNITSMVDTLKAAVTASTIKKSIDRSMEKAGETYAIAMLYGEVVSSIKDGMEQLLRHLRKNRKIAELRPRVLTFSRDLLGILRAEHRFIIQKFSKTYSNKHKN